MIEFKETLLNLHKAFPNLELEDLLKIMDCIVIKPLLKIPEGTRDTTTYPFRDPLPPSLAPYKVDKVYCSSSEKF